MNEPRALRLLLLTAEPHPTFRADVRVLFGKYLPRFGVGSDLLTLALPGTAEAWPAGEALLAPRAGNPLERLLCQLRQDLRVFALLRSGRYDAVQVRDRVLAAALALWAARRAGLPFCYWSSYPKPEMRVHGARLSGWRKQPLKWLVNQCRGRLSAWLLYRWVLPRADQVFVQSEAMKADYVRRGIAAQRMFAVPMGVDLEALDGGAVPAAALPAEWRERLAGRELIVYAGSLDPVRKPELMLEVIDALRRLRPAALLLMVGGSVQAADLQGLQALAAQRGLGAHVLFTGWVEAAQALRLTALGQVGLSIIPRGVLYDVSSPTKLAEYLALGVPALANDLPDQLQVLNESGAGLLVPAEPERIAEALAALLADPARRARMAAAGRAYVAERRSYAALAAGVAQRYQQLRGGN